MSKQSNTFQQEDVFDAQELLALARIAIERNDLESALRKLKRVIDADDVMPEGFALTARLYAQLGMIDRAQELFKRYLAVKPDALHERFELGMTCFDAGDHAQASENWRQVLAVMPTHPPALFYTALLATRDGNVTEAKRSLDILFQSSETDNLYFTRGRDLLRALEDGSGPRPIDQQAPGYFASEQKTEH